MVCSTPNLIELYYSLAYKECFSILFYRCIWYGLSVKCVCGTCTFASENLTVKGLSTIILNSRNHYENIRFLDFFALLKTTLQQQALAKNTNLNAYVLL